MDYYTDYLSWLTPGGTGGLTADPGEGLAQEPGAGLASGGEISGALPLPDMFGLSDILEQFGGQQAGSLGERVAGTLGAGFAPATLANIAGAFQNMMSVASPMAPANLALGYGANELIGDLPGYAQMGINAVLSQNPLGISPTVLREFEGHSTYPDIDALRQAFQWAGNNTWKIMQLKSALQKIAESHEAGGALDRAARETGYAETGGMMGAGLSSGYGGNVGGFGTGGGSGGQGPNAAGGPGGTGYGSHTEAAGF